MYHPEWGQSKWSGQLRKTHWQGHPDEFWTSGPSAHAATFRPGSRQCTPREAMSASERLYRNEKRYSRRSGRYRSATPAGCDPYARRAAQNDGRRRGAASTAGFRAPEFRNRPKSASAARRKKRDQMKEAVNITRRPSSAGSSRPVTPVIGKPLLNAQKMRDYGYGIPRWSPYAPTGYRVSKGTGNQDYGEYTKHDYLKRLSDLLAEHGRKSGADLKMLLDPSMKSLMERRNKEEA